MPVFLGSGVKTQDSWEEADEQWYRRTAVSRPKLEMPVPRSKQWIGVQRATGSSERDNGKDKEKESSPTSSSMDKDKKKDSIHTPSSSTPSSAKKEEHGRTAEKEEGPVKNQQRGEPG